MVRTIQFDSHTELKKSDVDFFTSIMPYVLPTSWMRFIKYLLRPHKVDEKKKKRRKNNRLRFTAFYRNRHEFDKNQCKSHLCSDTPKIETSLYGRPHISLDIRNAHFLPGTCRQLSVHLSLLFANLTVYTKWPYTNNNTVINEHLPETLVKLTMASYVESHV